MDEQEKQTGGSRRDSSRRDRSRRDVSRTEETRHGVRREWWVMIAVLGVLLTGLPAIFAWPAERILYNPDSYKQALAEQNAYARFPQLVGEVIAGGGDVFLFGSGSQLLQVLQRSDYDVIVRQIFPDDWVQAQANGLIDQFWAYFNLHVPDFHLVVDFRPVKARLNGDEGPQIAAAIEAGLPECSGQDFLSFLQQVLQGKVDRLPLCHPPAALTEAGNLLALGALRGAAAAMPDQLDLAAVLHLPGLLGGRPVTRAWAFGFGLYRFTRQINPWLPVLASLLLALVAVLSRQTRRGPIFWVGLALALPGLIAVIIALVVGVGGGELVPYFVQQLFGPDFAAFDILVAMIARVAGRFMLEAGIIAWGALIVGAGLLGVALWLARAQQREEKE